MTFEELQAASERYDAMLAALNRVSERLNKLEDGLPRRSDDYNWHDAGKREMLNAVRVEVVSIIRDLGKIRQLQYEEYLATARKDAAE